MDDINMIKLIRRKVEALKYGLKAKGNSLAII
jgi:hypothetical protein